MNVKMQVTIRSELPEKETTVEVLIRVIRFSRETSMKLPRITDLPLNRSRIRHTQGCHHTGRTESI